LSAAKIQKEREMAQRKKGRAAPRERTVTPRKTRGRAAVAKGRTSKRSSAKVVPQKRSARAKTKRIIAKLITPKKAAPRKQPKELPIEVVKVEQVDEPAPGVVIVSEYESVQAGPIQVTAVLGESK
jgi:hypothetical protein